MSKYINRFYVIEDQLKPDLFKSVFVFSTDNKTGGTFYS